MFKKAAMLFTCATVFLGIGLAQEGSVPSGIPHLDHVFVIMMENHGYSQLIGNPNAVYINNYAKSANLATNYFAVAHPSLTNYLEVTGGSNFGVLNDNAPDWHNASCTTNLATGTPSLDNGKEPPICPIEGQGTDAATPAIDFRNETTGPPGTINIDGKKSIPADHHIIGKTIADQLDEWGMSWKSYQESLPRYGANNVNASDGFFTDKSDLAKALPGEGQTEANLIQLYAVKHNPFAYFRSVQEGMNRESSLANVVGFLGYQGLFEDLRVGNVPNYSFIAPNQCNDMHGRGNAGPACESDPNDNGTQAGLNPGLIRLGDLTVENIVFSIHASPVWKRGRNAIVLVWDENDYSVAPIVNKVVTIVDTNYGVHHTQSAKFYDHFSLLRTIEAGLGLPCLNHACDKDVNVMSDLFAEGGSAQ
ncbi:MAG TPA: alkaline phosphatase family protein [Bryobacteraceae bacterium]|jgi:hypothetical protein|nr:alkaline phosphatase family protein [Bryobacteraceae bacterium]